MLQRFSDFDGKPPHLTHHRPCTQRAAKGPFRAYDCVHGDEFGVMCVSGTTRPEQSQNLFDYLRHTFVADRKLSQSIKSWSECWHSIGLAGSYRDFDLKR